MKALSVSACFIACISYAYANTPVDTDLIKARVKGSNVIFEFSNNFHAHTFSLHAPERFVIDFDKTYLDAHLNTLNVKDLPIYRIRSATDSTHRVRVVFDLKNRFTPLTHQYLQTANHKSELVIEFPVTALKPMGNNIVFPDHELHPLLPPPLPPVIEPKKRTAISKKWMPKTKPTQTFSLGRLEVSASGMNDLGVFGGDVMVPIIGNKEAFVFVNVMGDYGTDATSVVSPGVGYRRVVKNQILGAYFFGDYEKTSMGTNFWNLSPGIEWITPEWDAHLNGYFPTQTSQQSGATDFTNTFGDSSNVTFENGTHNQYDSLSTPYAIIGNGVDAELGYSFDLNSNHLRSRVYAGGYYYQAPSDTSVENITGVTAGFSQAITPDMSISLFNSYDQVTNYTVGVKVSYTFGGDSNTFSHDVHDRLFDSVERHVGIIDTGAANYDQQKLENTGYGLEYDNVYFMTPDGAGDGTFGNPMSLNQDNLNTIDSETSNSRIYLQGDNTYEVNETTANGTYFDSNYDYGLYVWSGQEFYGRSTDYTAPASSSDQPMIVADTLYGYNAFIITESGGNVFSDLTITTATTEGDGFQSGIIAYSDTEGGDSILTINNTSVMHFNTDVLVTNNGSDTMIVNTNNSFFGESRTVPFLRTATGMSLVNTGSGDLMLNATDSFFGQNKAETPDGAAYGLSAKNSGAGTLTANVTSSSFNDNTSAGPQAVGVNLLNTGTGSLNFNAKDSEFNNNSGTGTSSLAAGLYAENSSSGQLNVVANSSQFNNNTSTSEYAQVFGAAFVNSSTGSLSFFAVDSQFNNNAGHSTTAGLVGQNLDEGSLSITALTSQFNNNTGNGGYGIYIYSPSLDNTSVNYEGSSFVGNSTQNVTP